jgi:hypothetical protein
MINDAGKHGVKMASIAARRAVISAPQPISGVSEKRPSKVPKSAPAAGKRGCGGNLSNQIQFVAETEN